MVYLVASGGISTERALAEPPLPLRDPPLDFDRDMGATPTENWGRWAFSSFC